MYIWDKSAVGLRTPPFWFHRWDKSAVGLRTPPFLVPSSDLPGELHQPVDERRAQVVQVHHPEHLTARLKWAS